MLLLHDVLAPASENPLAFHRKDSHLDCPCKASLQASEQNLVHRWEPCSHERDHRMPLNIADIGIQLLMDTTCALKEIKARMTALAFGVVDNREKGPAVRQMMGWV